MTTRQAQAIAAALGGAVDPAMPSDREAGVLFTRPDGRFASIEGSAAYLYRDFAAHEMYHIHGHEDALADSSTWGDWDGGERWAKGLAYILGGEAHHTGGNIWVVFVAKSNGHLAVIGETGAAIYPDREAFDTDDDGDRAILFDFE